MLSKKNRAGTKAIKDIFEKGRFVGGSNLTFKFVLNPSLKSSKISFIAPKSIIKTAVKRNLLRRRGYAALKKHPGLSPVGVEGAFVFGKKSLEVFGLRKTSTYDPVLNIENEIKTIFNKIH